MATWIHFFPQKILLLCHKPLFFLFFFPSGKNLPHEKRWMEVMTGVWITTIHPKIVDVPHLQDDHMTQWFVVPIILCHIVLMMGLIFSGLIFQPSSLINLIST